MHPQVQSEFRESFQMADCAQVLVDLGVPERVARPLIYRGMWKIGLRVRPPLYSEPVSSIILTALVLGFSWGALMRYSTWDSLTTDSIFASLFFGFAMALFFRWQFNRQRREYSLPSWQSVIERAKNKKEGEQGGDGDAEEAV